MRTVAACGLREFRSLPRAVLLGLVAAACAETGASADLAFTVRDSAGVTIVESSAPAWPEGSGWRLSSEPSLEIGMTEGPEVYLLSRVTDAHMLADGSVIVANRGSAELRYYDPSGRDRHDAGRLRAEAHRR